MYASPAARSDPQRRSAASVPRFRAQLDLSPGNRGRSRSSVVHEVKLHPPAALANSAGQPNGASMPTASDLAIISLSISSSQPRHGVAVTARSASQVTAQASVPFGWEDISIPSVITAFIVSILPEAHRQLDYRR